MTSHTTATREAWLAARLKLLDAEKDLSRHGDEVACQRQALPWVAVDKSYIFDAVDGDVTLVDLFRGCSQLIVYHFMFGTDWEEGCPSCSSVADGFNQTHLHLQNHDVAFTAVSRAPLDKLLAYRDRMGWSFPWASSAASDFNYDFNVSFTTERVAAGQTYNFRPLRETLDDLAHVPSDLHGMSAFAMQDDAVFHTYSTYSRGVDAIWNMWHWLDRAPLGRNEGDMSWFRRHDTYGTTPLT